MHIFMKYFETPNLIDFSRTFETILYSDSVSLNVLVLLETQSNPQGQSTFMLVYFSKVVLIRSMHQSACWVFWQEIGTLSLAGVGPSDHHVACLLWPCNGSNPSQLWLRGAEQAIQVRLSAPLLDLTWPTMPLRKGSTTSFEPNRKWTQYIYIH